MASFDSLPDELALKIVKMAAQPRMYRDSKNRMRFHEGDTKYDHDFLVDVICKVSLRFKRLTKDPSFWAGRVTVSPQGGVPYYAYDLKTEFVVQECLNSRTSELIMYKYAWRMADPTTKFPNLKLAEDSPCYRLYRRDDEDSVSQ